MLATWRWASKQTSKQEQDEEWPALPYLSSKEAEAQEDGSEQHFLLPRVRWRKPYLFIFKLVTQQPNISQKDAGTNSRIQAQISQLPSSKAEDERWTSIYPLERKHLDLAIWHEREVKWQNAFWSTPKVLSAAGS